MTPVGWRKETDNMRHHRERHWDYRGRGIYHVTLVVAEHYPLFGEIVGDTPEESTICLSEFGKEVWDIFCGLPQFYAPKGYAIKIIASQIMPDHFHFILQVLEPMPHSIGTLIRGYKAACTNAYKKQYCSGLKNEPEMQIINSDNDRNRYLHFDRIFASRGTIWENDIAHYHERILHSPEQLQPMIDYVKDNPRRLAIKRANPELFKIKQQTKIGDGVYTTLGNMFLAENPMREVLQCSRTMTEEEIEAKKEACLAEAANGTVYVSAAVSQGEKQICRALREAGYPLIVLLEEGFPKPDSPHYKYFKPSGVYFEACSKELLLLVEPNEEQFERAEIEAKVYAKAGEIPHSSKRYRFLALNALAEEIARGGRILSQKCDKDAND